MKNRKRKSPKNTNLEDEAAAARNELVNAYFYMMQRDNSAEMRRNFQIIEKKLDRKWEKYQDSLKPKKNRPRKS